MLNAYSSLKCSYLWSVSYVCIFIKLSHAFHFDTEKLHMFFCFEQLFISVSTESKKILCFSARFLGDFGKTFQNGQYKRDIVFLTDNI